MLAALVLIAAWAMTDHVLLKRLHPGQGQRGAGLGTARRPRRPALSGGELGSLAQAFDGMAMALEKRAGDLHDAETKYRQAGRAYPAVIYTASLDGRRSTHYVNPQIAELLGFSAEEWTMDPMLWSKQVHADHRAAVLAETEQHRRANPTRSSINSSPAADASALGFRSRRPGARRGRRAAAPAGVILDITDRKAVEEHLIHNALH